MKRWTRADRVIAYIRLVRKPVSLVDVTNGLGDDFSAVSAMLSRLFAGGELNRIQKLDEQGRWRYFYTDPEHDELMAAREVVDAAREAVSHDCEEPTYVLTVALDAYDKAVE
jgi:predicted transcriptional regulator